MKSTYDKDAPRCRAYETQFNIALFNAAVQLAIFTTEGPKQVKEVQHRLNQLPWYVRTDAVSYFEQYEIRYFGELLERYGEKLGGDVSNIRAIALAMGWCAPLMTQNMFVAGQKHDFMKKLSAMIDDLYITVARYLLAVEDDKETLRERLMAWDYKATEEIIFALCSLEDTVDAYDVMRVRLVSLLGTKRTFATVDNAGIYAWLVSACRDAISACRKKDNALPRAIMAMSTGYVRAKHTTHKTLVAAGFSHEEILYLNSMFIWEQAFRHCQVGQDSSPAEHLAADFVVAYLNMPCELPASILDYIKWLLSRYFRFDIKLEKCEGLWEFISGRLNITCPETMLWMIQVLQKKYEYRFDVLNDKWDILAQRLPREKYHVLFRDQLLRGDKTVETVKAMLDKYVSLLGVNYVETFEEYSSYEDRTFWLLVKCGVIDLWSFFEAHRNAKKTQGGYGPLTYVWETVKGVKTEKAFAFWKRYFTGYTVQQIPAIFRDVPFHDAFYTRSSYGYGSCYGDHLSFKRGFLTRDENRQLYEWIDASAFAYKADEYPNRVLQLLKSDDAYDVFDLPELKPIFDALLASNPKMGDLEWLKNKFLSDEELAADKAAKEAAEIARKKAAAEAERKKICDGMDEAFDGTLTSIRKYMVRNDYWDSYLRYTAHHARGLLSSVLERTRRMSRKEFRSMMHILGNMVAYDDLPVERVLAALQAVSIEEEPDKNGEDK